MSDPVSWLMIESGWKALAVDGSELGRVKEVEGDKTADIFDGLAVTGSAPGKPRYVLSEQVGVITPGTVHLKLTRDQFELLEEIREPAASEPLEPEPLHVWQRIKFFFRGPS